MSEPPLTFKGIVEADLWRAVRLGERIGDEIDPQLRMATPEGDYWLAVTLPLDAPGRLAMFERLGVFMAWKGALAFTLACELDAERGHTYYCAGISRGERWCCWIACEGGRRGDLQWLPAESIDPAISGMLPPALRAVTPKEVQALEAWFGASGKFPAVHIATREVRGV